MKAFTAISVLILALGSSLVHADVHLLFTCGDVVLKYQDVPAKGPVHYVSGVDANSAEFWIEKDGKQYTPQVTLHQEGGNFKLSDFEGQNLTITLIDWHNYGLIVGNNPPVKCERSDVKVNRPANTGKVDGKKDLDSGFWMKNPGKDLDPGFSMPGPAQNTDPGFNMQINR